MLLALPPDPSAIVGQASVIDGDTIEIHGQRIRLWGIDSPESGQTCERGGETYRCGQEAAFYLADFIGGRPVVCVPHGRRDRYRRIVADCSVRILPPDERSGLDGPFDLATEMVMKGWALDYPRYSASAFITYEAHARDMRSGMHAGAFIAPWEWRGRPR